MDAKAHSWGRARLAFLLAGTAAIAMLAGKPAHAISINEPLADAAGGVANYFDSTNQFPNVASLFSTIPDPTKPTGLSGSFCTGTFPDSDEPSRTVPNIRVRLAICHLDPTAIHGIVSQTESERQI